MDKLATRLRDDAAAIDAEISTQLDSRIQASLAATGPETAQRREPRRRVAYFWLASSLTGVAAALALIAVLNVFDVDEPEAIPRTVAENAVQPIEIPALDLDVKAATLAGPLAQELEDLQADLKKAEEVMRGDVRIDF
jgi:hypothetical protein